MNQIEQDTYIDTWENYVGGLAGALLGSVIGITPFYLLFFTAGFTTGWLLGMIQTRINQYANPVIFSENKIKKSLIGLEIQCNMDKKSI